MAEWQRVLNTTIHEYIREEEENILRDRKFLAMLKDRGRITFNHAGDLMDWKVRHKRAPIRVYRDSDTLTFSRINRWKTAQLDWRGYAATDSITKFEKLKNKGPEAIIKVFDQMTKNLMDDISEYFGDELYVNGYGTGNTGRIHGLESFFGTSGVRPSPYPVCAPNSTYAGLLCTLGQYGGTWTLDGSSNVNWPDGKGDPEYDFWSPLIIDYTNANWSAATKTWANTCGEALRYGIIKSHRNRSVKGQLDCILLERELFRQFEDFQDGKERLVIKRGDKEGGLYALGFSDAINYDGVDLATEFGVPSNTGYGLSIENCELRSLQDQMFVAELPDFDISTQSDRFSIDFFGNLRVNPRFQVKFINQS